MESNQFVNAIASIRKSATFMTLHKYKSDASGEVADFSIVFNISYKSALERSIKALELYSPEGELEVQAKEELLLSFHNSLNKMSETTVDELDDGYSRFKDEAGNHIKGIKFHDSSQTLELFGFIVSKRVIEPGVYKKVNKRPLTIAKDKLRRLCPVDKFRQFKIKAENLEAIVVENKVYSFEE